MIRLETARLLLREARPRDAAIAAEYYCRNRDFLSPWEPTHDKSFYTAPGQRRLIRADLRGFRQGTGLRLWIFLNDDGNLIGNVALTNIVRGPFLSCFLGYRLDAEASGHGYMSEAVNLMLRVAFGRFGLHRVEANVMPRNAASIRVLEKCGFQQEGRALKYLMITGKWEDHLHFVALNHALNVHKDAGQLLEPPAQNLLYGHRDNDDEA